MDLHRSNSTPSARIRSEVRELLALGGPLIAAEPMLRAVSARAPHAQLAWEAPLVQVWLGQGLRPCDYIASTQVARLSQLANVMRRLT